MSAARIARKRGIVEHLGVWVYDTNSEADSYATGGYRPLCGQERDHSKRWQLRSWIASMFQGDRMDRKPVCSRCVKILEDLTALVGEDAGQFPTVTISYEENQ